MSEGTEEQREGADHMGFGATVKTLVFTLSDEGAIGGW